MLFLASWTKSRENCETCLIFRALKSTTSDSKVNKTLYFEPSENRSEELCSIYVPVLLTNIKECDPPR